MVWMSIFLDSGAQTIARPTGLDMVEHFLNVENDGRDYDLRGYRRRQAVDAIATGEWSALAAELGVTAGEIDCFLSDAWGEDRDIFLAGVASAIGLARRDEPIRFVPAISDRAHVGYELARDVDGFTVVLYAPERNTETTL